MNEKKFLEWAEIEGIDLRANHIFVDRKSDVLGSMGVYKTKGEHGGSIWVFYRMKFDKEERLVGSESAAYGRLKEYVEKKVLEHKNGTWLRNLTDGELADFLFTGFGAETFEVRGRKLTRQDFHKWLQMEQGLNKK